MTSEYGLALRTRRSTRVPLITTYHPDLSPLRHTVDSLLPVLHTSQRLRNSIPEPPIVAHQRPRNLRDLLVRAELKPTWIEYSGSSACLKSRCKTCQHIRSDTTFKSTVTGQTFLVRASATCKTENLIYLIECKLCKKQYVGETENRLHIRLNGHRSDITNKRLEKPVAHHFNLPGHSLGDLTITVIEKIHHPDVQLRRRCESYWIHHLKSLAPGGLNLE